MRTVAISELSNCRQIIQFLSHKPLHVYDVFSCSHIQNNWFGSLPANNYHPRLIPGHTANNVAVILNKITSTCNTPPPLTRIASCYFTLCHANAIIGFSNYGQLLRDLIAVLLRTEPERRPSAEQILCIPMMQSYVNDYVGRMSTIREQYTPLPVRRPKRAHDNAGVSPSGEKENVSSF